jgi:hypothetical protein
MRIRVVEHEYFDLSYIHDAIDNSRYVAVFYGDGTRSLLFMIWTMVEMQGLVHDVIHGIHGDSLHIGAAWCYVSCH